MHFDAPKNANYAATVVCVDTIVQLEGLDNLVGVPVLGHQALTQRDIRSGDLRIAFTSETQLSEDYCAHNNLYRDETLNKNPEEKGYLEKNRRVRALKLRGHVSNALLMPLDSLAYTGTDPSSLRVNDSFDALNGHEVCRKYEIPVKANPRGKTKIEKAFRRVDSKLFPEHISTGSYWRNKHDLKAGCEVVVTQKLHGSSIRVGRVPVLRKKGLVERFCNKVLRVMTPQHQYELVAGSRKVIKDPGLLQNHYYGTDVWHSYGQRIGDLIPEGVIVYGELIGFTADGAPLQKSYTYDAQPGEMELYVYRVAHINAQGFLSDLSWDGVKDFCRARGLKWVPELFRTANLADWEIECLLDQRFADSAAIGDTPLRLSDDKTVDEGVCLRQEGLVPLILKAKSPKFLEHETRLLDKGEADLESVS